MADIVPRAAAEMLRPLPNEGMAGLVHDLGNYIQIAMSAVRLMAVHPDVVRSDALGAILAQARDSLDRAGTLARSADWQGGELAAEELNLNECILQMVSLLRCALGPDLGIRLHVGLLPTVRISRLGLQNALLNLAINARDAMLDGGTLSISAWLTDGPEQAEVEIVVADDGIGMPPTVLERAFEPRFSTKPAGMGMGLYGVRSFVEAAGGRVAIVSKPASGTSVSLRLPVSDSRTAPGQAQPRPRE